MEVDQKHVTTIRMHDAKGCDIRLGKDANDYQLQLASGSSVVNITLGFNDLRKLCQQMIQLDMEENWKTHCLTPPEFKSFLFNSSPRPFHEAVASWCARMANDSCVSSAK